MKTTTLCLAFASLLLTTDISYAQDTGDCAINYNRTACPGQETESFSKCDGKATCTKQAAAKTAEECQAQAVKACANNRINITKSKVITATWKGQPLKSASGNDDFCADYANRSTEFDKCDAQ